MVCDRSALMKVLPSETFVARDTICTLLHIHRSMSVQKRSAAYAARLPVDLKTHWPIAPHTKTRQPVSAAFNSRNQQVVHGDRFQKLLYTVQPYKHLAMSHIYTQVSITRLDASTRCYTRRPLKITLCCFFAQGMTCMLNSCRTVEAYISSPQP